MISLTLHTTRFVGAVPLVAAGRGDSESDRVYRRAQVVAWFWRIVAAVGVGLIVAHLILTVLQPAATDAAMREWAALFGHSPVRGNGGG